MLRLLAPALGSVLVAATLLGPAAPVAAPDVAPMAAPAPGSAVVAGHRTRASSMPGVRRWRADVREVVRGSSEVLQQRVAQAAPGERLALNLDIDNTSLQTFYRPGRPVRPVLRLAREAEAMGVAVLFNTARRPALVPAGVAALRAAGFSVDGICSRHRGEGVVPGKQRCRADYAAAGYTLVYNIGNRATDLEGAGYERSLKLPDYGMRLG